jgi:hypothetical protein
MVNPCDSLLKKLVMVAQICYSVPEMVGLWFQIIVSVKGAIHSQLNWAILLCDVIPDGKTEQTAQFWQAIAQASELSYPVVFRTQNCAGHSGNPTVSSVYLLIPVCHTRKKTHRTDKKTDKNWQTWRETCAVPENIQFSFLCSFFFHSWTAQFNLGCMGPFRVYGAL